MSLKPRKLAPILFLMLAVTGCETGGEADQEVQLEDIQEIQTSIDELQTQIDNLREEGASPVELEGEQVTVNGAVEEILGDNAMTVTGDDFWQFLEFEPSVLVALSGEVPEVVEEGDVVQITGTVQTFTAVEFEEDYGLDLEEEIVVEYENQLALADAQVEPLQ